MIERYTLPEMDAVWSLENKFKTWLDVELAVVKVQETHGVIPAGVYEDVKSKAAFNIERIDAIEAEVRHDVIAFLTNVAEYVGENSRYVHQGMTSSDLIDTAMALQIRQGGQLLIEKLDRVRETVYQKAVEYKHTPMVGRSHGIHGEPITFGLKLLVWVDELDRQRCRLLAGLESCREGQISGAMGTYSNIDPLVEFAVCEELGLRAAKTSTQVIQRDNHAELMGALANLASSIEKFSVELRHLQRTDVLEVEEGFAKGQKGSSAMPHKRNPISGENLTGLARLVRSYAFPVYENIALWHERDISHSSVERVVFPDGFILMHYMLNRFNVLMEGLGVYPDNMMRNMNVYGGVIFSQRVLLALTQAGVLREDAYRLVQRNAHAAWNTTGGDFKANLLADAEVGEVLSAEQVAQCFDAADYLKHVDTIFNRFEGVSEEVSGSQAPAVAG